MPVIPTFAGFAQTPNLAQAWLGGQNVRVEREKIAQQAAEAAQRASVAYAQIANQRAIAELETTARSAALAQENLLKQQEIEFNKAYRQQVLGLQERDIQRQEQALKSNLEQIARRNAAREEMYKVYREQEPLVGGREARASAVWQHGIEADVPPSVMTQALEEPQPQSSPTAGPDVMQYAGRLWTFDPQKGQWTVLTESAQQRQVVMRQIDMTQKEIESQQSILDFQAKSYTDSDLFTIADQFEHGELKDYNKLEKNRKAKVDIIVSTRKNLKELKEKLSNQLRAASNGAFVPPGAGTNVVRKTIVK